MGPGGPFGHCRKPRNSQGSPCGGGGGAAGAILILLSFSLILVPPPKLTRICLCKPEARDKPWVSLLQLTCVLEECLTRQTYSLTTWGRQSACGQPATEIVIKGGKNCFSFSGLQAVEKQNCSFPSFHNPLSVFSMSYKSCCSIRFLWT